MDASGSIPGLSVRIAWAMELARGTIVDRPWAQTLGALARRGFTGQLTLHADDGKQLAIAFERGLTVGATSPIPTDAIVRIALTNHFVFAGQVAALARRITTERHRDEVDILVEAAGLTADQELALRERAILQRAARTFSIDAGTFVLDDHISIPTSPCIVDPFAFIYAGVRMNQSEQRLLADLRWMGTYFEVPSHASDELLRYRFGAEEQVVVEAVRHGTSIPALEVEHRELDPRTVQAVLFTLAACGTANASSPSHVPRSDTPTPPRRDKVAAGSMPNVQRIHSTQPLVVKVPLDEHRPPTPASSRTTTPTAAPDEWRALGTPAVPRVPTPSASPRTLTPARPTEARTVSRPVLPPRTISRPVAPSRTATPTTGSIAKPPAEPLDLELDFTSESPSARPPADDPHAAAVAAFRRGEAAIGSDALDLAISELTRATQLHPEQLDYAAMLAWAKFCAAPNKPAVADVTRKTMALAVQKADSPILGEFLLGRVERMLGRDREALVHFQRVLELRPRHPGAAAEIRVIELRQAAAKPGGGLFGRKH